MVSSEQAVATRPMTGGEAVGHAHAVDPPPPDGERDPPRHAAQRAGRRLRRGRLRARLRASRRGRRDERPGVINTATPAATAYADSVPLLIVSPAMPTDVEGRDTGYPHECKDQRGAMDALVSWSRRAASRAAAAARRRNGP
jgi:Thiamine pyrophosphate enzyme, N-terminal TPP binding domain